MVCLNPNCESPSLDDNPTICDTTRDQFSAKFAPPPTQKKKKKKKKKNQVFLDIDRQIYQIHS